MNSGYRSKADKRAARHRMRCEAPLIDIAFDADEFSAMSLVKRSELCVSLAVRAKVLADAAPLQQQEDYLLIAHEWLRIAEEIERAIVETGNSG